MKEISETNTSGKPKSPLSDFASIPTEQLQQILGDSMVSSVNGFFVEIDSCMSVERCSETGACYQ